MNYPIVRNLLLLMSSVLLAAPAAIAQDDVRTERVRFERGGNSAVVEGSIAGYDMVDYVLGASEGQYMNVSMSTDNTSNYFNILAPGEDVVAMFNSSMDENQFSGILPESGDYKIRLYLMRNAARRNERANYRLEMLITTANAATRAGLGDFDATGQIPCSQAAGQPMGRCDFGVAREGGGTATVVITRPAGWTRAIFFIDGKANSTDTSEADGYGDFKASRESDLTIVRVGDERYEIPDAVIYGG